MRAPILMLLCAMAAPRSQAASVDPVAPRGWTVSAEAGRSVYRPGTNGQVELRLHPANASSDGLGDFLRTRLKQPVDGLGAVDYGAVAVTGRTSVMATGRAGSGERARFVMALACRREDGAKRYAELILPQDILLLKAHARHAGQILAQACLEAASAVVPETGTCAGQCAASRKARVPAAAMASSAADPSSDAT